ncbi:MAG: DNA methyltransferase, partial [Methermicoccaceae archaeon]
MGKRMTDLKLGHFMEFEKSPISKDVPLTDFTLITPETPLKSFNLDWSERDLPEKLRTKHVHGLHPYLGKYVPQLVETFLRKYEPKKVLDPFCGSGTTLVEASALGINSVGCDISTFNCLLSKVKTDKYDIGLLQQEIKDILRRMEFAISNPHFYDSFEDTDNNYLKKWFSLKARKELLLFKSLIPDYENQDILKIILSRSARSARLTTHFDLDFPKKPQTEPYYCYKHR